MKTCGLHTPHHFMQLIREHDIQAKVHIYLQLSQTYAFLFLVRCAHLLHAHCLQFLHFSQPTANSQYSISQYMHFVLSSFDIEWSLTPPQLQFDSLYLSSTSIFFLGGSFFCFSLLLSSFCFTCAAYASSDVRMKNFSSKLRPLFLRI